MTINKLTYYTDNGLLGLYGEEGDPFLSENACNPIYGQLCQTQRKKIKWIFESENFSKDINFDFGMVWHCILSEDRNFLVVHFDDDNWPWPWNCVAVFNDDGTLRGKLAPPIGLTPSRVEGIHSIRSTDHSIDIGWYYNRYSVAYIEFDPKDMSWKKVVHIGSRA